MGLRSEVKLDWMVLRLSQGNPKVKRYGELWSSCLSPMFSLLFRSQTCLSARAILAAQLIWLAACRQLLWDKSSL